MMRSRRRVAFIVTLTLILGLLVGFSTIGAIDTAIEIITSPASPVVGQSVAVTWRLTAQTGSLVVFSGDLTRQIDSPAVGSWDVLNDTVATSGGSPFSTSSSFVPSQAGTHTIEGSYPACPGCSPPLNGSSESTTVTVDAADTTTTVTLKAGSNNPSVTGESVTFTATVASVAPGSGTPANGTDVYFEVKDNSPTPALVAFGSPILSGGTADFTVLVDKLLASKSPYTVTATFDPPGTGDTNYNTSTSSAFTQNVNKPGTTTVITTNLSATTVVGQAYTVSGTVQVNSPGSAVPGAGDPETTGTVEVSDGTDSETDATLVWNTSGYWDWTVSLISTTAGTKAVTATYSGDDNYSSDANTVSHTVNKASTTVAITGDASDPSYVGVAYTVSGTVDVVAPGDGTPTGNVTVSDGTVTSAAGAVAGDGSWSCSLTSTTAGSKTLTATYSGDDNYNGDTDDAETHAVNKTVTTVAISPGTLGTPTVVGQSYTVSGRVTPDYTTGTHTNDGDVEVSDGTDSCTDATLEWNATGYWDWSCVLTSTTVGSKTLTATFAHDDNYVDDAGTESHTVNQAATTVTITAVSPSPSVVGQTYTVSGTVDVVAPGSGTPTGNVTVSDSAVTSAGGAVAGDGSWSCSLASTTVGVLPQKTLTATYLDSEDPDYAGSTDTESHTVNKADTTTTVTSDINPSVTGEEVEFTATVAAAAPGSGTPTVTATMTFYEGGSSLGQDTDGSDGWKLKHTFPSAGAKTITATYSGDGNYKTSTSSAYTQNVNKPNTVTTITGTSLATSTLVGISYTVNGTVTVTSPGSLPLTGGTVTVSDGTVADNVVVTPTLSNGTWTGSFTSTTAGAKTITATYSGDASYNGSTDTDSHDVTKGTVTVGITQNLDPWTTGASGDFTATVTAATGSGTPSGTVTFQIKDKNYVTIADSGPHTLSGGSATSDTVTLTAGQSVVHVTATYSGDANFATNSGNTDVTVYPSGFAITGDDPDPSLTTETYTVTWAFAAGYTPPTGATVTIDDGGAAHVVTYPAAPNSFTMPARGSVAETRTITATYAEDGSTTTATSTEQHDVLVLVRATATAVTGSSDPACVSQPVLLTATVTDETASPDGPGFTGTVTWKSNGNGTFDPVTCNISQGGQCSTYYTPVASDVGTVNIVASYSGDDSYDNSISSAFALHVAKQSTQTTVFGSDTPLVVGDTATFLVTVSDTSNCVPTIPTGGVSVSVSPLGAGVLIGGSHTLIPSDGEQFTFTYTPTSKADATHEFTAAYTGSTIHNGSDGSFTQAIIGRIADVALTPNPTTAFINQDVVVTVRVEDATSAGTSSPPTGTITFSDGTKAGAFSSNTATLSGGECTVVYTPAAGDAGTTTITASYGGSSVHLAKSTSQLLTVNLRPTETRVLCSMDSILVNQSVTGCTVTVEDIATGGTASVPDGTVLLSTNVGGTSATSNKSARATVSGDSQWTFDYVCTGINAMAGFDLVQADFTANDGIHESSTGGFAQAVQRRPTVTTLSGCSSTATGVTCTATTEEDSSNAGSDVDLTGNFVLLGNPDVTKCSSGVAAASPSCNFTAEADAIITNVSVRFDPTDKVHLASTGSENVDRSDQFDPSVSPGDASACTAGCGNGGINIDYVILGLNTADLNLSIVQMGLEAITIITSFLPDIIVGAGFGVISGVTIPVSDIAAAITGAAGIGIEIARTAMTTDLDGDGLPSIVETLIGTSDVSTDSDGDGMDDMGEISAAGGYFGGSRRPDPTNPDSDGDGLSDGDEADIYQTNFCVGDTDCDTVSDGEEVGTWGLGDERDHLDPLLQDTDGDGIRDDIQYATHSCMYGNEADSDDDGLEDGTEDWNADGVYPVNVAGTGTQASTTWESNPCDFDTDGDGLSDGEEFQLLGGLHQNPDDWKGLGVTAFLYVSATVPGGGTADTIPALDTDSDDDGLSDFEEVNFTGTDPLDADTDNDGLNDDDEVYILGGTYPNRTFDQESDPLDPDTDDDGLRDDVEFPYGTVSGTARDVDCPYVNDDDSDNDGLKDGTESWDGDATITTGVMGNSVDQADTGPSGETLFCDPDTDNDGLTDGEEVALLGGLPVDSTNGFTAVTPQGVSGTFGVDGPDLTDTVPPLDDDSDNDGLSDYEEVNITGTDPLDADSDNDTLSDANELIATGGTWPNRTFIQVSDPLDPDTDDDDLYDQIEYPGSGLGLSRSTGGIPDNTCPYVNDDDSDDDGLQDGVEDANHDGTWGVGGVHEAVGSSSSQAATNSDGYYETNLCDPDTDGDGLLDGEEPGLIGGEPTPPSRPYLRAKPGFVVVTPEGVSTEPPILGDTTSPSVSPAPPATRNSYLGPYTFSPISIPTVPVTIPALDSDSDNDGLSDYEEVNITGTDPLDADSDNDTIMDADELIATGGAWPQRTFDQESDPLDINTDDDHLFDPQEYAGSGLGTTYIGTVAGDRDTDCPYVNDDDSDDDSIQDGARVSIDPALTVTGTLTPPGAYDYSYTHYEDFVDVVACTALPFPGKAVSNVDLSFDGEQRNDSTLNVCDPDSDGDGLNDGEEIAIGTNPDDCDTDNDGRNDWHEVTGGGPIPTDPFDPDTDDDGLLDSAEVFGMNPTNPVNADTDGDGLCDGGTGTPWMMSTDTRVIVNPICKSCAVPGLADCGAGGVRTGSVDGIGDHPNPHGYGEDKNGNGDWDGSIGQFWQTGAVGMPETDPNQYDTDGDADGDGIEVLGFSTSRQSWIPATDIFGRTINVPYPACGCLEPLIADTDGDGLEDGYEDNNHDGNFDFLPSDFDYAPDPLPGPPQPNPNETNPCNRDTDTDDLTDYEERYQSQVFVLYPGTTLSFNPTNPLDHDTDNDRLLDGFEVKYECVAVTYSQLDNDGDALFDEDEVDGLDNDGDGLFDEDPTDFFVRFVPMLDPTCRDSDSDGWMDGLDDDPCNSELIPLLPEVTIEPIDTDGDGFSDDDEIVAGTHPNDPEEYPTAYCMIDLDFDQEIDDRLWLEPTLCCGIANSVAIDIDSNVLIDARVRIIAPRDVKKGDFDGDGSEDDYRYVVEYAFSNYRVVQPRIVLTIDDYNGNLVIDHAEVVKK